MQTEQDLEKLVHAHTAALLRYCTGLLGCEADAQDAVQKTFIKAWQQRRTLRGDGTDNECAWLYRIAYRTALDMLRAARARPTTQRRNRGNRTQASATNCVPRWPLCRHSTGRWCWSACWTAWTMPRWHASMGGPPPTCAHAITGPKNSWPHD